MNCGRRIEVKVIVTLVKQHKQLQRKPRQIHNLNKQKKERKCPLVG